MQAAKNVFDRYLLRMATHTTDRHGELRISHALPETKETSLFISDRGSRRLLGVLPCRMLADRDVSSSVVSLANLDPGQVGEIVALEAEGMLRHRLLDLGFIPGSKVQAVRRSPLGDPKAYRLRGAVYALRNVDARLVKIRKVY